MVRHNPSTTISSRTAIPPVPLNKGGSEGGDLEIDSGVGGVPNAASNGTQIIASASQSSVLVGLLIILLLNF